MLKLTVDLWNSSLQIKSFLCDNLTGRYRELPIVFDTGAYITVIDTHTLVRAGYNVNRARNAVLGLNVIREFETRIKFGVNTTIELIPMFDLDDIVQPQNFIAAESRFGHWSPGQE